MYQSFRLSFHQCDRRVQRIRHIHHIHQSALLNGAHKLFSFHCRVVNIDSIIGRTSSRRGHIRNNARKTDSTSIDTVFIKIVITQQLCRYFSDSIHGTGTLNGVLRCFRVRRTSAKRTDRTRSKHRAPLFTCHFQHIPQSIDAYFPSQLGFRLGNYGQQSSQVINRIDMILFYYRCNRLAVRYISNSRRSRLL